MFNRSLEERFRRDVLCHVDAAYNLARWIVGNGPDAVDAVQDANLRAFQNFSIVRGSDVKPWYLTIVRNPPSSLPASPRDVKPWYLTIVRNVCLNQLKARKRRNELEGGEEPLEFMASSHGDPVRSMEASFEADRVRNALAQLPVALREVTVLREFEQLSYREIADVTNVPIGTVMSRLSRARDSLLKLLSEEVEI